MIPDREKVMRGLEHHSGVDIPLQCEGCPYDDEALYYCSNRLAADVLALMKEQEQPVRCAECKYYGRGGNPDGFGWCGRPGAGCSLPEDFYCKDGTKKAGEDG